MVDDWRPIEEFPMYEMNSNKEVRHMMSQRVRRPQFNGQPYLSFAKDGKNYSRTINSIFRKTFPEMDHSDLPKPGRPRKLQYHVRENQTDFQINDVRYYRIPTFPEYGINRKGDVINLSTRISVTPSGNGELSMHLRKDGRRHYIAVRQLMKATFG